MKRAPIRRQRGLALVCALMLLLGAMLLGLSVVRAAFGNMASARHERERMLARAAAEAALLDAQADIAGGAQPGSERAGWFAAGTGGFADGCGRGNQDLGLCLPAAAAMPAAWQAADLAAPDSPVRVPYGRYTGAVFAVGGGTLPVRLPGYLIERLTPAGVGPPAGTVYRITAMGFGTRETVQVVLQALYRKLPPAAASGGSGTGAGTGTGTDSGPGPGSASGTGTETGPTQGAGANGGGTSSGNPPGPAPAAEPPAGRIGWREVANWPALHAQAIK